MKGTMIIKEILACMRGRRLSPMNGGGKKGPETFPEGLF